MYRHADVQHPSSPSNEEHFVVNRTFAQVSKKPFTKDRRQRFQAQLRKQLGRADVGFGIVLLVPRSDLAEAITSRLAAQNNTIMLLGLRLSGAHLTAEMMQKKQMTAVTESRWWILTQNLKYISVCSLLLRFVKQFLVGRPGEDQAEGLQTALILCITSQQRISSPQHPAEAALMSKQPNLCWKRQRERSRWWSQAACSFHYKQLLPSIVCFPAVQQRRTSTKSVAETRCRL